MKYLDIAILLLFIIENSVQKLQMSKETTSPISDCIVSYLHKYFNNSTRISIKYSNEYSKIVSATIQKIDLPTLIVVFNKARDLAFPLPSPCLRRRSKSKMAVIFKNSKAEMPSF